MLAGNRLTLSAAEEGGTLWLCNAVPLDSYARGWAQLTWMDRGEGGGGLRCLCILDDYKAHYTNRDERRLSAVALNRT